MLPFEIAQKEEKALHGIRIRYHEVSGGGQTGSLIRPLGSVLAAWGIREVKSAPPLAAHSVFDRVFVSICISAARVGLSGFGRSARVTQLSALYSPSLVPRISECTQC